LAIVMDSEYADTAKTGIFPSGKCYVDYLLFIREKMCKEIGAVVVDNDATMATVDKRIHRYLTGVAG